MYSEVEAAKSGVGWQRVGHGMRSTLSSLSSSLLSSSFVVFIFIVIVITFVGHGMRSTLSSSWLSSSPSPTSNDQTLTGIIGGRIVRKKVKLGTRTTATRRRAESL